MWCHLGSRNEERLCPAKVPPSQSQLEVALRAFVSMAKRGTGKSAPEPGAEVVLRSASEVRDEGEKRKSGRAGRDKQEQDEKKKSDDMGKDNKVVVSAVEHSTSSEDGTDFEAAENKGMVQRIKDKRKLMTLPKDANRHLSSVKKNIRQIKHLLSDEKKEKDVIHSFMDSKEKLLKCLENYTVDIQSHVQYYVSQR